VIVAVAFVTMAIGVNARTAFSLLFPPILDELGWARGETAGAFSFGFLVTAVLSPLLGKIMDRFGPRIVVGLGIAAMATGLGLASLVSEPWHLYSSLGVLVGAGGVCLGYTGMALFLPNWFVRKRGLAMSIAFSGVGIGSILVLPALQLLIEAWGWRQTCMAMSATVVILLAPLSLLLRKVPAEIGLAPDGDAEPASGPSRAWPDNVIDAKWAAVDWTLARAARTSRFWWIAAGYACAMFAWYAVQVHQTRYLVEIGFDAQYAAWALGCVSLAAIPGQIALGHLSDSIGREWVWAIGNVGFAVCYLALIALGHFPAPALVWLMVLAQGFLGYGLTSVIGAIPAEIFQGRHYGGIFGTLMGMAILGGAIGPWVTGLAFDVTGSYAPAYWMAVACCIVSAFAIWIAAPRKVRAVAGRIAARAARVS
jgi:MFS family permease